ncbi:hypothetical protein RclHR1_14710003 [Rhizophagus clarus]|uniref:Uncharacterized protein n=1 Tax=Rhizophagus clarus TaxID=94130 RepID=A0A2Z6R5X4_9GLOM|nr:hypothetical protein RclHR1_14710003 [Rhizophagus clarus]
MLYTLLITFFLVSKQINLEHLKYKRELQRYWQGIIREYYEKENLIPKAKLRSNKTISTKVLSETSQSQIKQKEKRNNDTSTELKNKKQKQNEDNSNYYMQKIDDFFLFSVAYKDLIEGNVTSFVKLLKKRLSTRSRMSLSSANEPVLQAIVELLFPLKHHVPELCLIMNNTKKKGNGRFGFVDIFVLGEEIEKNYICVELKYISLLGLVRNINGKNLMKCLKKKKKAICILYKRS